MNKLLKTEREVKMRNKINLLSNGRGWKRIEGEKGNEIGVKVKKGAIIYKHSKK